MQVRGDGPVHELFRPNAGEANSVENGFPQMLNLLDIATP